MQTHGLVRLLLVFGLVLALVATPAGADETADDPLAPVPLVVVPYDDLEGLYELVDAGLDIVDVDGVNQEAFILAHAFEQEYFDANDVAFDVIHENLNVFPEAPEEGDVGTFSHHSQRTNYRFIADYYNELEEIASTYSDLTRLETIGHSIENRPIVALEVSSAPGVADGRPEHVHMALHHAREWPSSELALDLAWYLVENYGTDERVTDIVDNVRVYIIPLVNPDGFNYSRTVQALWRKNRNPTGAVDPNRNYDYNWGGTGSSGNSNSQTYRGVAPFSEPETQAIRDFYTDKHLVTTITGHTHGGWWLYPWGYKTASTPDAADMGALAVASVQWSGYTPGPTNTTLYATSGDTTDFAYGVYRSLAFTPEYGTTGSFHPPFLGQGTQPHLVVGSDVYEGRYLTGSLSVTGQSGRLVDCGLALVPADCPDDTEGAIALIERGDETFANKALNAASRGAIAAVIYNNTTGHVNGTLAGNPVPVPVVGIPRANGLNLLGQMADGDVDATLETRGANSYAQLWNQQLPAFLLNIEAAADHAARISGTVSDALSGEPVSADLDLSLTRTSRRSNGQLLFHDHETSITTTGEFDWAVLPSAQPEIAGPAYDLAVTAANHYPQSFTADLPALRSSVELDVELSPLATVWEAHQLESVTVNSTLPFRFFTLTPDGTESWMGEVSVSVLDGDDVVVTYHGEGRGSSVVRESGQPGRYIINIDTNALGLDAGTYDLAVDFTHDGGSYRYTVPMNVVAP